MASARHILVELPYTVSSMKNNHLLGDGLGLVVLGSMFPGPGERWRRIGDRLMVAQLRRHMRPDGSMIEDSLSYHRFVLEMLCVRQLIGDAPCEISEALEKAGLHLVKLGVLDGPVPQFGDWDEGRVLADSSNAGSTVGSTFAALALSGYGIPARHFDEHDELAWYVTGVGEKVVPRSTETSVRAGDFVRIDCGQRRVWIKAGSGPSHQHADVTSVWIRDGTNWVTRDPGTGTYNGPLHIRNGFRTSAAHPVWVPAGRDQLEPHRAFRWLRSITPSSSRVQQLGDATALLAVHDAFADVHGRVARLVLLHSEGVTVVDAVELPGGTWTMTLPLGDEVGAEEFFGLEDVQQFHGEDAPWSGWHSRTYGAWEASTWLVAADPLDGQKKWGYGVPLEVDVEFGWKQTSVEVRLALGAERVQITAVGVCE
ncbi:heparinase II/III family protein [Nocardioides sp. S5]|uniref:heparinase II/III domain-containing protein n=1 Tax=Nocardioides sp. S5 TaxID=2017486 RepID=UPI001A8F81EA|nr:heparinase II/III family protein [Nocardioides sp. S5]